ncbi:hypothetical protein PG989_008506 [Apiospora arundinis]
MATAASNASPALDSPQQLPAPVSSSVSTDSQAEAATASNEAASDTPVAGHSGLRIDNRAYNGAHSDGRVRNPIPSKLKGKTDLMKGNFNVMHMELSNRNESQARYEAAKRNSESTALQAKLAETPHYVSHHRRANYARPRPGKTPTDSDAAAPAVPAAPASASTPTPVPEPHQALSASEVKAEQARLLTLIRSLPHATVVDQVCKALAFFGGIPDAPPPADGKFPESGEANGTGNLFVGWISEIFPDLTRPQRPPAPPAAPAAPARRPRGRPKGSKATKVRRDKGLKKGSKPNGQAAAVALASQPTQQATNEPEVAHDESWVDVDEEPVAADPDGDVVERRVFDLLTPPRVSDMRPDNVTPASGFTSINNETGDPGSSAKRRGRPKGSKNRPKAAGSQETPQQTQSSAEPSTSQGVPSMDIASSTPIKSSTGRSKGSKGKNNAAANSSTQASKILQQTPVPAPQQTSTSYIPPPTLPTPNATASAPSQVNGGGNKNKRTQLPPQSAVPDVAPLQDPQPTTPQVKASTISGAKRKRQPNKVAETITNGNSTLDTTSQSTFPSQQPEVASVDAILGVNRQQNMPMESNSTSGPPPKRPRKSNSAAAKRQSAATAATAAAATENVAHTITPTVASPDLPHQAPQQSTAMPSQAMDKSLDADYDQISALQARNDQNYQAYSNHQQRPQQQQHQPQQQQQQQQQHQQQASSASRHSIPAAPAEGLAAHYEQFTASMQSRQQSAQSNNSNHPHMQQMQQRQQQHTAQTVSPTPSHISKPPQMTTTLPSQQSTRATANAPNYYSQNQSPSYTVQQGAYSSNPRQQHSMTTNSPGTTLVSHVTHSPQFGTQNNSPLMGTENSFRGSPSISSVHPNASYAAPRRTTSASSMDNPYRTAGNAAHGVSTQSPHFGTSRPTPASSHGGVASFPSFSDQSLFDMQALDSSTAHNGMGMGGAGAYALGSNVQRTNSGSGATSYPNSAMTNGGYDINKSGINTGYGRNRWS